MGSSEKKGRLCDERSVLGYYTERSLDKQRKELPVENSRINTLARDRAPAGAAPIAVTEIEAVTGGRETILREAAKLFSAKGFAESGLREIAEMAGIRASTIYYHFPSKESIYEEIIRLAVDTTYASVCAELAALPAGATPRMRIEAAITGHLRALHSNKPFTSTNAQSRMKLPEEVNAVIRPVRDHYSQFWRGLLEAAESAGWLKRDLDPRMLRPLILGTLNRTVGWFDLDQGPVDTLIRTTILTYSGIWAEPPPAAPVQPLRKTPASSSAAARARSARRAG